MTPDHDGYLSHRQIMLVLSGLVTGLFLATLDSSIVSTALPLITSDLGGLGKLSWVVTAYLLTATASTPLWGKVSDLYGRRPLFQASIVVFVLGSLLCGVAQNMTELIAARAVQGLGGGGLIALVMATVGDIIPPRERPRYQGYLSAVFGVSSVLGPVLGGFFAEGPGWRWIFFINVPIGAVALVVTSLALKMKHVRRDHTIDYLGAATLMASVTSILLFTAWAGPTHGWGAASTLWLLGVGLVLGVVFVLVELRAAEPILPMELFRNSVFRVSSGFGFLMAMAMYASMVFLPLYLQLVDGMSPTKSGLAMLPVVGGMLLAAMGSGRYIVRTGRYKSLPIIGSVLVGVALVLFSRLDASTPYAQVGLPMFVLGLGLGMTNQVVIIAVQNAVDRSMLGVATAAVQFFRNLAGAFGTALFGAILTSRLVVHMNAAFHGSAPLGGSSVTSSAERIQHLPEPAHGLVLGAFTLSLRDVFLAAIPVVLVSLGTVLFLKEVPLGTRGEGESDLQAVENADAALVH